MTSANFYSLSDRTIFKYDRFVMLYKRYCEGDESGLQEMLAMAAGLSRKTIYSRWHKADDATKEDLVAVSIVEAWRVIERREIDPKGSVQAFLSIRMKRKASQYLATILKHLNTYELTEEDARESPFKKVSYQLHYSDRIKIWLDDMLDIQHEFRMKGKSFDIAVFVLKFRVFFGHWPVNELIWLNWGRDVAAGFIVSYVRIRWRMSRYRMIHSGRWIPETWREYFEHGS